MANNQLKKQRAINIRNWLVIPYKETKSTINSLLAFFQYESPNESSIHSSVLETSEHDVVIDKIIECTPFSAAEFVKKQKSVISKLKDLALYGDSIYFQYPRFVCYQRPRHNGNEVESRLLCFLKHIRNSIAHGRLYISKDPQNPYFLFEDVKDGEISARIFCRKNDLEKWKTIIESQQE